jgi:hypothetical protein
LHLRVHVPFEAVSPALVEAISSDVELLIVEGSQEHTPDLSTFPPNMRLREIRDAVKTPGRKVRLYVKDAVTK